MGSIKSQSTGRSLEFHRFYYRHCACTGNKNYGVLYYLSFEPNNSRCHQHHCDIRPWHLPFPRLQKLAEELNQIHPKEDETVVYDVTEDNPDRRIVVREVRRRGKLVAKYVVADGLKVDEPSEYILGAFIFHLVDNMSEEKTKRVKRKSSKDVDDDDDVFTEQGSHLDFYEMLSRH